MSSLDDLSFYEAETSIVRLITVYEFIETDTLEGQFTFVSLRHIYDGLFLNINAYFKIASDHFGNEQG
ncbi:hypothetical protein ES692_00705 [Psychroserpens burtonensis]|uniref:Uncharacterized protein n=1 Tax=Psychroserpens burtonensis TaxID=49278 RepID=A0A5C7BJN2_9FLAO|nr:hypothetical protein [Psychroserpens burtonensis]TXE20342.1 hypothetical protein ES692_00705 [Psychroserpens burtonensis]